MGKLEMEIAQLSPDDAIAFMQEYGIEELGLSRMIRLSMTCSSCSRFFTVGEDEVRAWTWTGATAVEAAAPFTRPAARFRARRGGGLR